MPRSINCWKTRWAGCKLACNHELVVPPQFAAEPKAKVQGKRAGLDGNRSGLFFEAIRLIKEIKPACFIFENVKGLITNNNGKDFIRCLQEIGNIGLYDCEWQLVNTRWFLPQNRERIYFIGHLRSKSRLKVFPIRESDFKSSLLQGQQTNSIKETATTDKQATLNTITTRTGTSKGSGTYIIESQLYEKTKRNSQGNRINTINRNSVCLSSNSGGQGAKTGLYAIPVITPNRLNKRQNGRRFKTDGEPSFTITTQDQHGVCLIDNSNASLYIRRLTPLECERLQGFPDNWTKTNNNGNEIKDTNRYRMIGNAVSVKVVKEIIKRLIKQ